MRRWFRNRSEKRLDQELRFHFEEQMAEYVAAGLSPEEARRMARIEFGNLDEVKEECRDVRHFAWFDGLRRDVRFALRMFARSPGFTAVCLITLALSVGFNGAIFGLVNELLLTPPPYERPQELVVLSEDQSFGVAGAAHLSFYLLRDRFHSLADVAVVNVNSAELATENGFEAAMAVEASSNILQLLGVAPELGRWFTAEEERTKAPVLVLSHKVWRRVFGADPNVIGRSARVVINSGPAVAFEVIGVLPEFLDEIVPMASFDESEGLFIPLDLRKFENRNFWPTRTIGRLANGRSPQEAADELVGVKREIAANGTGADRAMFVRGLSDYTTRHVATGLWVLTGAVGLVLLIACANLAGLLLSRSAGRRHEISIRRSLGAGQTAVWSQVMVETLVLCVCGGGFALFVAWAVTSGLKALRFSALPHVSEASLDWPVVICCLGLGFFTALLIGAIPAWTTSRFDSLGSLRSSTPGLKSMDRRTRDALVVMQVALAVVLVVGSGLLVNSMWRLLTVDPGYNAQNVISFTFTIRNRGEGEAEFWRQVLEAVEGVPGVESAAMVSHGPGIRVRSYQAYELPAEPGSIQYADSRSVSENYFSTLDMRFLAGRGTSPEVAAGVQEVVVNKPFAHLHWPGANAVGQSLRIPRNPPMETRIVGVVEGARQHDLQSAPEPMMYVQNGRQFQELLVRTQGGPSAMVAAVREAIERVDRTQAIRKIETLESRLSGQNAELRFYVYLLSSLAALALVLTVVGLYAVAAQAAAQRTQEIGLRMAVGANRSQILMMIARQGLVLAAAGIVLGMAAAYALSKYLESWLYEITPTDTLTFGAAALLLAAVAWFATFIPARRAARLDPMNALRYE